MSKYIDGWNDYQEYKKDWDKALSSDWRGTIGLLFLMAGLMLGTFPIISYFFPAPHQVNMSIPWIFEVCCFLVVASAARLCYDDGIIRKQKKSAFYQKWIPRLRENGLSLEQD